MSLANAGNLGDSAVADRIEGTMRRLTQPISMIGVLGMLAAAGATCVDIVLRTFFQSGVPALNEVIAVAFSIAVAACIPMGIARRAGIRVDVLESLLTPSVAAWMKALGSTLLLLFLSILTLQIGNYASGLSAEGRTTVILGVRLAPIIYATTALLTVAVLVQATMTWADIARAMAAPSGRTLTPVSRAMVGFVALLGAATIYGVYDFDSMAAAAQSRPMLAVGFGIGLMWLALLALIPLTAVMGLLGLIGCALFIGFRPSVSAAATEAVGFMTSYQVASLPLFLLMGSFAAVSGVSADLYRLAQAVLGRFRGGVAMATVGGCAGFGAVTGSSLATVVTFGRVALPQMERRGYNGGFAAGCVAAGGTLGALIPPSSPLIIFALLTEASIGQLFVAAVVPGVIAAALYLITIAVVVRLKPGYVPRAKQSDGGEILAALRNCGAVALLFGVVIGGMYSGFFTATEAAAVGAFIAFLIALLRGRLRREQFWEVMSETTISTAMIYTMVFSVLAFSFFVGISGLPEIATGFVSGLAMPPLLILVIILVIFLMLGSVMDSFTVMIITVPILTPVVVNMGYDLIWWGILNLVVVEIGLITPPFGLHLFVLKSMMPKVRLDEIYAGIIPFTIADAIRLALIVTFPVIVLWLPMQMMR